jgi:uncharacterized protein
MSDSVRAGQAIALARFDLSETNLAVPHGCEDCACAVSESSLASAWPLPAEITGTGEWIRGREVMSVDLDDRHHALFNPLGSGGVLVVNQPGLAVFHRFDRPVTLAKARISGPDCAEDDQFMFDRLARLGFIHPDGMRQQPDFAPASTLTAWLHVTNACNLRCPYCYVRKSAEHMDEPVGRASVEAVFRSAIAHGFPTVKLKYAGGEASLNHQLMLSLHQYAGELAARHEIELQATLLSNGVKLHPAFIDVLRAQDIRVMISLDGIGRLHDQQRPTVNGKPSFLFVKRTINDLMEHGHAPHLSITITNRNHAGVADAVRFALDRDLTFSLNFFRDNDCSAQFSDLQYEEQAMIGSLLDAFGVIEERLPRWSVLGSILDRGQLLQPRERPCGVGQDYVVIDQRGRIAKCHMEIERTLGDVVRDDPLELVRRDLTLVQNPSVDQKEGCRDCTWRYWCSGGCSVATFRATGRYDVKSPNCGIYRAIYPAALRLEGLRILKYADMGATPESSG